MFKIKSKKLWPITLIGFLTSFTTLGCNTNEPAEPTTTGTTTTGKTTTGKTTTGTKTPGTTTPGTTTTGTSTKTTNNELEKYDRNILTKDFVVSNSPPSLVGSNTSRFIFDKVNKKLFVIQVLNSKLREFTGNSWSDENVKKRVVDMAFTSYLSFASIWKKIKSDFPSTASSLEIIVTLGYYKDHQKVLDVHHPSKSNFYIDNDKNNFFISDKIYLKIQASNVLSTILWSDFGEKIKNYYLKPRKPGDTARMIKDNFKAIISQTYDQDQVFLGKVEEKHKQFRPKA